MQEVVKMLPPLFYKSSKELNGTEILYSKFSVQLDRCLSFRSFDLEKDIDLIYKWVNEPYAIPFWKMNGSKNTLIDTYSALISCPDAHSFIGLLGDEPICQIDVYRVLADELSAHILVCPEDCGMHLLMAPNHLPVKGLSKTVVAAFLKFYFSFSIAGCMYGEPDKENHRAKKLLDCLGFEFLKEVELSYKTACVYRLERKNFNSII